MTQAKARQWQEVRAPSDKKNLGKSSQNSNMATVFQRELLLPEAIEQLEIQRRWFLILGPFGVL